MKTNNLKIELDVHTHTLASGHAYGTISEMVSAAAEKGLKLVGISEHTKGIPGTCEPIYFNNLEVIPRHQYGITALFGAEINIFNDGSLSVDNTLMKCLDYRIAGVHSLCYEKATIEENTQAMVRAIAHPGVDIISHPDDGANPIHYEKVVLAAKENNTLLEINNNSLSHPERRLHCKENYKEMLYYCKKYETPVIISSDAHHHSGVGNMGAALTFLETIDFEEALIINTSCQRFLDFIEKNRRKLAAL